MPSIQPFRGIRYDLGHVGSLADVVAPPYDVIDARLQDALYKRHPANVVRLILNRQEPGDDEHNNRYTRAAQFLKNWLAEGVLFVEPQPALYVYHQVFASGGQTFTRRGFMGRQRLEQLWRGQGLSARRDHGRAEAGSPAAHAGLQGEPKPDLWPVPRSRRRSAAAAGDQDRRRGPARSGRPPGRRSPPVASHRSVDLSGRGRADRAQADVHCRRPSPLRNGLQLSRRVDRRQGAAAAGAPSQFRVDDGHRHERSGFARAAHAPALPRRRRS